MHACACALTLLVHRRLLALRPDASTTRQEATVTHVDVMIICMTGAPRTTIAFYVGSHVEEMQLLFCTGLYICTVHTYTPQNRHGPWGVTFELDEEGTGLPTCPGIAVEVALR